MRSIISIMLALLLLAGCSSNQEPALPAETTETVAQSQTVQTEPTETVAAEIIYDNSQSLDFGALLKDASAEHKAVMKKENPFAGFENYLVNDPAAQDITLEEAVALMNNPVERKEFVTYEQAVEDIETVFRVCHVSYGAYYYFGAEAFENAKLEILQWLEGQETVNVIELERTLQEKTAFMRDRHSTLGMFYQSGAGFHYEYYDCQNQTFSKDEQGYYKTENGSKWYLESFSNEDIQVRPALQADGAILYEPVLFTPNGMAENDVLTLKNGAGETRTEPVLWKATAPLGEIYEPDYRYLQENNITYISMRQFNEMEDGPLYKDFMQTGKQARDSELVIFDLRSNTGGNGESMYTWIKNFSKVSPQLTEARAQRNSAFFGKKPKSNYSAFSKPNILSGKWISNDIPVIVLVDDYCASAGERALNLLTTMENVLVIGSNTDGCQLGGNSVSIFLPNSGIRCYIGTELCFVNDMTNLDCIGYEPDIWCNPTNAMESVLNMLKQYELASEETVSSLYEKLDGTAMNRNNITLGFLDFIVPPNSGFGTDEMGIHYAAVLVNGEQTDDFTVESLDPNICVCEKTEDGRIQIQTTGTGFGPICVTVGKTTAEFTWVCMP